MRPELRRLAVLTAALAPSAAERLLSGLAEDGAGAAALAATLARAGREARIEAVAAAFAEAAPERGETPAAAHPLLQRLAREERVRAGRPS